MTHLHPHSPLTLDQAIYEVIINGKTLEWSASLNSSPETNTFGVISNPKQLREFILEILDNDYFDIDLKIHHQQEQIDKCNSDIQLTKEIIILKRAQMDAIQNESFELAEDLEQEIITKQELINILNK